MKSVLIAACLLLVAGCSSQTSPSAPAATPARELADKVTADGMYAHLEKLADIAAANGNSRADGTPGFDASVDYVARMLRDKGFDVETPEFDRLAMRRRPAGRRWSSRAAASPSTRRRCW